MNFRADIHIHSIYSDGTFSPKEILFQAKKQNLSGISITDHDTIEAYTPDFFILAKELEIEILTGVEISSQVGNMSIHILGYGFSLTEDFFSFLEEIQKRRRERNVKILEKLAQKNMLITEEELLLFSKKGTKTTLGRPHIASLMVKKKYVNSFKQAFFLYLKEGGSCYVAGNKFSPLEIIEKLHKAKGKAVLAHPHFIKNKKVLDELLQTPFDGIEAYYGKLLPYMEKKWVEIGKEKNWIITGGSDFHGDMKPYLTMGSSWVGKDVFDRLRMYS